MGKKAQSTDPYKLVEEEEGLLQGALVPLTRINGYQAVVLMTHASEILVGNAIDKKSDLHGAGAVFNDIFRAAHSASEKIGLGACLETTIKTPKGLIIMRCSGTAALAHFHLIAFLSSDGNQALARMELEKMVPHILDILA